MTFTLREVEVELPQQESRQRGDLMNALLSRTASQE